MADDGRRIDQPLRAREPGPQRRVEIVTDRRLQRGAQVLGGLFGSFVRHGHVRRVEQHLRRPSFPDRLAEHEVPRHRDGGRAPRVELTGRAQVQRTAAFVRKVSDNTFPHGRMAEPVLLVADSHRRESAQHLVRTGDVDLDESRQVLPRLCGPAHGQRPRDLQHDLTAVVQTRHRHVAQHVGSVHERVDQQGIAAGRSVHLGRVEIAAAQQLPHATQRQRPDGKPAGGAQRGAVPAAFLRRAGAVGQHEHRPFRPQRVHQLSEHLLGPLVDPMRVVHHDRDRQGTGQLRHGPAHPAAHLRHHGITDVRQRVIEQRADVVAELLGQPRPKEQLREHGERNLAVERGAGGRHDHGTLLGGPTAELAQQCRLAGADRSLDRDDTARQGSVVEEPVHQLLDLIESFDQPHRDPPCPRALVLRMRRRLRVSADARERAEKGNGVGCRNPGMSCSSAT